jgi:hypothetical protein
MEEERKKYNTRGIPKLPATREASSSMHGRFKVEDDLETMIETGARFIQEDLDGRHNKSEHNISIYVDEDAYPDAFNHQQFLEEQKIELPKIEHDLLVAKKLFEKLGLVPKSTIYQF